MPFYADLHIHSKYSRATSRNLDFFHLALWAKKKGIGVVGTGDFTHPAWMSAIRDELVPAEPGLFRLRAGLEAAVDAALGSSSVASEPVRFLLEVEISTIYKQGDKVRKVHHLLYAPDLASADRMTARLARIGNIASDGRPILGLNSRDLLEICLSAGEGSYLIPAHIWTPWFSVFGSKSGFDRLEECYGDLTSHIFALETGLSSDPPMNWRLSMLDGFRLVSNSDAHSPGNLGREACRFDCPMDYFAIREALATGRGYGGSMEFFPEEGKYHLDGHRACGFRCEPEESLRRGGLCPVCGSPLTLGVHYRVVELADRETPQKPENAPPFRSLIPLPELLGEIHRIGAKSKAVQGAYEQLIARLGPELAILAERPLDEIGRAGSPLLAEGIRRMRNGEVVREGGFDGEYGVIRAFRPGELERPKSIGLLFELPEAKPRQGRNPEGPVSSAALRSPAPAGTEERACAESESRFLGSLDPDQRAAAEIAVGPLLIVAGPGTGKTRTLTHRLAHLVADRGVSPESCLAITFTRRAAREMRARLARLLPEHGDRVPVMTFHGLGLSILRENQDKLGLAAPLRVAGEREAVELAREALGVSLDEARRALAVRPEPYIQALRARGCVDFEDLGCLAGELLAAHPDLVRRYRERWRHLSIDEYQDIDERQYRLAMLLSEGAGSLCVIGDPDQAIYGFRGADVRFFQQFQRDYPDAPVARLTRNYRSTRPIVEAALQAVAPGTLVRGRVLRAQNPDPSLVTLRECGTDRAEAEFLTETIERLVGGTSLASFDTGRVGGTEPARYAFGDFAILYRTDAQTPPLVEALTRSGIPFQKRTHTPLLGHPTVRELVASMKAQPSGASLADRLAAASAARTRPDAELRAVVDALLPLAEKHGSDFSAFSDELALGADVDLHDARAERVSLLTLHAAKGLEFRVVFLVGCEDGLLPHRFGREDREADPAEERRLFFVGITRARDRLFLSHARRRFWQGEIRDRRPSPFLSDIRETLLDRQREEAPGVPRPRLLNLL